MYRFRNIQSQISAINVVKVIPKRSQRRQCVQKPMEYKANQRILVLGDGNFSFSRGLVEVLGRGDNVTSTSLDTRETVVQKYGDHVRLISYKISGGRYKVF
jgi:hypothetical protein